MHQIRFRLGLCPRPRWGSLQRPSDILAGFKGPTPKGKGEKGRVREGRREGKGKGGEGKGGEGTIPPSFLSHFKHCLQRSRIDNVYNNTVAIYQQHELSGTIHSPEQSYVNQTSSSELQRESSRLTPWIVHTNTSDSLVGPPDVRLAPLSSTDLLKDHRRSPPTSVLPTSTLQSFLNDSSLRHRSPGLLQFTPLWSFNFQ